jgi:hydroxyethylthiazole kinase-like uncharacterized protein yjeF
MIDLATSPRPWARGDVLALTAAEAAAFDAAAIDQSGVPEPVLMENAGRGVAAVVSRLWGDRPVVGLVGPGNNGGDTLVALRTLATWGRDVVAVLVSDRGPSDPLLHGWPLEVMRDTGLDERGWDSLWATGPVVLDGLLGTGARGAPRPRQAEAIGRVQGAGCPVLALDIPSGIDATTGAVPGVAVRADITVSFGAPKLGSLLHPARSLVGRQLTLEIGFPPVDPCDVAARVVTPSWARARLPVRDTDTHKNRVGRVLVVGGGFGMAGAAILAARAAFRSGAGLVRICTVEENREIVQTAVPDAIWVAPEGAALDEAMAASDAIAVGPGLGRTAEARQVLERVAAASGAVGRTPLVLDADALNLAAEGVVELASVAERRPTLITPHPGEMARLLGHDPGDRLEALDAARERHRCTVLLKGAPSLTAAVDGPVLVDSQSSSDLAVAGMGDTLTGVAVALAAQGCAPEIAGALGLYLTGRAAALAHRGRGLTPSDVVDRLPDVLAERTAPATDLGLPMVTFDADPAR